MKRTLPFGSVVITSNADNVLDRASVQTALARHINCDWGDLCPEDKTSNDEALETGERILSAYKDRNGTKFWVITESDRSATTILLPEDY